MTENSAAFCRAVSLSARLEVLRTKNLLQTLRGVKIKAVGFS